MTKSGKRLNEPCYDSDGNNSNQFSLTSTLKNINRTPTYTGRINMQFSLNVLKQMFYNFFYRNLVFNFYYLQFLFFIKFLFILLKFTRIHMLYIHIFVCIILYVFYTYQRVPSMPRVDNLHRFTLFSQPLGDDERALHTNRPT